MDKQKVLEALTSAPTHKPASKDRLVAGYLDEIEAALEHSTQEDVAKALSKALGISLTRSQLAASLTRARRRREKKGEPPKKQQATENQTPSIQENETGIETLEALNGLDKKKRRERLADKFITSDSTNPILSKLRKKES